MYIQNSDNDNAVAVESENIDDEKIEMIARRIVEIRHAAILDNDPVRVTPLTSYHGIAGS